VIACTAYAILGEAQHCLDAGMDDYLSKPLDLKRLGRTLGKWLPLPARIVAPAARSGDLAAGPIDTEALGETSGGDRATERELLLHFESCNDEDTDVLRRAIAQSNLLEVRHVAHRMKGAGRMIGAVALADACERIERAARADDAHGVASSVPSLDHELERLRQYLKTL
jgi:HPt (histidine-containing phosphotransfer) domain-containing protein